MGVSLARAVARLSGADVTLDTWSPDPFSSQQREIEDLMGVSLEVSTRKQIEAVTGGTRLDRDTPALIMCDRVHERPLRDIASV